MTTTAREFGSKATDARIAARVQRDYTRSAWRADSAIARNRRTSQEATVTTANQGSIDTLLDLSAARTPWVPQPAIIAWAKAASAEQIAAKVDWLYTQPVALVKESAVADRFADKRLGIKAAGGTPSLGAKVVPAGRYAVTGEDGATKFYRVDQPTEGRWAGYTFVKVQAGDELHNVRNRQAREAVLVKIAKDGIEAAMLRYGKELGQCGHCGRTLTNEESRARGIGPICYGKMGF